MNFVVRHKHEDLMDAIANVSNARVYEANQVFMSTQVALQWLKLPKNFFFLPQNDPEKRNNEKLTVI